MRRPSLRTIVLAGSLGAVFLLLALVVGPGAGLSADDGEPSSNATDAVPEAATGPAAPVEPSTGPPTEPSTPVCTPATPLVDPQATPEALCLAATLDDWQAAGSYGIGQQLNVSSSAYLEPVEALGPDRPALVGFDLTELDESETYEFAVPPLDALLQLNAEGVVLTASWHTANPGTGLDAGDRRWQELGELLDPTGTPAAEAFWADVDAKLELVRRLQTGDDGRYAPAAVLFRPLHEANGDWFWWAQGTDPAEYRALYAALQQRAWDAGVHNIVWGWSANAVTNDFISDPMALLPDRVDVGGIDSYEPMQDRSEQDQQLTLTGLAEIAASVPRAAVTEAGPHGSVAGAWDPTVIARSAVAVGVRPLYVMLWFDDGDGADGYSGAKQISSLEGGLAWLAGCPDGVCPL